MKKKIFAVLLSIVVFSIFASACTGAEGDGKKSETVISVAENAVYDESEWASYLAEEKDICLAKDGKSDYKIVLPYSESEKLEEDAEYLRDVLRKMTGSDGFEVITDAQFYAGKYSDNLLFACFIPS